MHCATDGAAECSRPQLLLGLSVPSSHNPAPAGPHHGFAPMENFQWHGISLQDPPCILCYRGGGCCSNLGITASGLNSPDVLPRPCNMVDVV